MEMMIIPRFRYLLPLAAALCLTACQDGMLSRLGVEDPTKMFESGAIPGIKNAADSQEKMVVNKVEFSADHKNFSVWTGIVRDIGPYPLTDSTVVQIDVESFSSGFKNSRREHPQLVKAENTERDKVNALGVKTLVLVDLSLSQAQIDAQLDAVKEINTVFDRDHLYLAFVSGNAVTPSRQLSPYILDKYFNKWSDQKLLFRSLLEKIKEVEAGGEPWADAKQVKLLVFSDGQVYDDDDKPFDPEHFKTENDLLHAVTPGREYLSIFYVNFGKATDDGSNDDSESHNILASVCETSGGAYFPSFSWTLLEAAMMGPDFQAVASNRFDFVNPDGKVYRGDDQQVKLKFYTVKDHKLIASATAHVREGTFFHPIIVNGVSLREVLAEGLSVGLFLLLAIYLVFQFLVPFIRYRLFLRKYVIRYTGNKMALGDVAVAESCYLCKAPFVEGDEIVVKCEHTMHKSCWDENEYHCPEFGRHCKNGSHFYDKDNLLDKRNASFYLKWLLMAIITGTCAWLAFSVYTDKVHKHLLEFIIPQGELTQEVLNVHLSPLPSYGFMLAFFLTLGVAFLAMHKRNWTDYADILLRALAAGVCSSVLYLLVSLACIALHLQSAAFLMNIIPWTLSSFLCAVIGTYGTRVHLKKSMVLMAIGVSLVSMLLWSVVYMQIGVDFRLLLLYSTLLYMIGMALAIASLAPKSEHYFLHVQGAVKSMDVALYKWFRTNSKAVVTLGRSVDCSLQLSWDLQGNVAPVHAEIAMFKGVPRLKALEEGVSLGGKALEVDHPVNLRHGMSFQIGQTLFTYLEKDI